MPSVLGPSRDYRIVIALTLPTVVCVSLAALAQTVAANNLCNSYTAFNTNYHDTGLFGVIATAEKGAHIDDLSWAIMHEVPPHKTSITGWPPCLRLLGPCELATPGHLKTSMHCSYVQCAPPGLALTLS